MYEKVKITFNKTNALHQAVIDLFWNYEKIERSI